MNRNPMNNNFRPASLRRTGTARTVLLRMAADQERADRIRALKLARPDLTWRRIADHVGVSERAASDWQKKGGIEYANAKKLAQLFEVDVDYIWRGTETAPDMFPPANPVDALEGVLADVLREIKDQLAEQTKVLDEIKDYARRVETMLGEQRDLKAETDEVQRLARELIEGRQAEAPSSSEQVPPRRKAAAKKRAAKQRTP